MELSDPQIGPSLETVQSAEITPEQIRAARAALGWSCGELAVRACLSRRTVWSIETGKAKQLAVGRWTQPIKQTLVAAGITFIVTPDGGCGILLKPGAAP